MDLGIFTGLVEGCVVSVGRLVDGEQDVFFDRPFGVPIN
jgi:hypothetical protein